MRAKLLLNLLCFSVSVFLAHGLSFSVSRPKSGVSSGCSVGDGGSGRVFAGFAHRARCRLPQEDPGEL